MSCEKPFWQNPLGLFTDFNLQYDPHCRLQVWNFIARILFVALVIGTIGSFFYDINAFSLSVFFVAVFGTIVILTTPFDKKEYEKRYRQLPMREVVQVKAIADPEREPTGAKGYSQGIPQVKEGFETPGLKQGKVHITNQFGTMNGNGIVGIEDTFPYNTASQFSPTSPLPEHTHPTARNLFMNILVDEYKYNPQKPSAASVSNQSVHTSMDDYFRIQWFSDPTDVYGKNQSQRQFVTQPSTSIPNDRQSYQDWLYKIPGKTCKEGGVEACLAGTDGGPVTWLNHDS
jgi:hypothetical protein